MAEQRIPYLVETGWIDATTVGDHRVLTYLDGTMRFEHLCKRPNVTVTCAPALRLGEGHILVSRDPLTITPSILCPDCGTHGFVREGRWVDA